MYTFKLLRIVPAVSFVFLLLINPMIFTEDVRTDDSGIATKAEVHFKCGQFEKALDLYKSALKNNPKDDKILVKLGFINLLSNKFTEAEKYLLKAHSLKPDNKKIMSYLGELYFRQDKYEKSRIYYEKLNNDKGKQLASFKGLIPYQVEGTVDETHVKFILTDPLPLFKIKVNGKEIHVLLDTGGAEIILDTEFAKEIGIESLGSTEGVFAGGKKAPVHFGKADSIKIGDFTINNVPIEMLPTRGLLRLGDMKLDGIVGTAFLYHFISTIDYPEGKLILRKRTEDNYRKIERIKNAVEFPFWMAGTHFMVAWGTANKSEPILFFVDTGMAGGGVSLTKESLKKAGIVLDESQAGVGMGGGGRTKIYRIKVDELTLGEVKKKNVPGFHAGSTGLADRFGFKIGGIVSHMFLRDFALTFNFRDMKMYLQRKKD